MITKEMRVSDVFRKHPQVAPLLIAHGICDCCGGHLTLEESAESKGIKVEALLQRLQEKISH